MRAKIILSCGVCNSRNYTTYKSKEAHSERIEVKKFCKHCNAHTIHRETK